MEFVQHYNEARLHSALGYVTRADKLAGREQDRHRVAASAPLRTVENNGRSSKAKP